MGCADHRAGWFAGSLHAAAHTGTEFSVQRPELFMDQQPAHEDVRAGSACRPFDVSTERA
jgi:hypothetical protein